MKDREINRFKHYDAYTLLVGFWVEDEVCNIRYVLFQLKGKSIDLGVFILLSLLKNNRTPPRIPKKTIPHPFPRPQATFSELVGNLIHVDREGVR